MVEMAEELGCQAEDPVMSRVCQYGSNVLSSLGRFEDFKRMPQAWLQITERGDDEFAKLQAISAVTSSRAMLWGEEVSWVLTEDLIPRARALGNPTNTTICLTVVGLVRAQEGRLEEAEELFSEALAIARPTENHYTQALTLMVVAMLRFATGRVAEAMQLALAGAETAVWKDHMFFVSGLGTVAACLASFGCYRDAAVLSGVASPVLQAWAHGLMRVSDPVWRDAFVRLSELHSHMDPTEYAELQARGRSMDDGELLQLARRAVQAVEAGEATKD